MTACNNLPQPNPYIFVLGVAEDCCMLSLLLAVPSCIYSFWHGVIPTSYFIFNDFYTCISMSQAVYTSLCNYSAVKFSMLMTFLPCRKFPTVWYSVHTANMPAAQHSLFARYARHGKILTILKPASEVIFVIYTVLIAEIHCQFIIYVCI